MSFTPDPLHTGHVRLPLELKHLREILAENVHDMWARQRMAEGWVYGPQRDDQARTHPCLVPYDQLPESEKDYDRDTAVETLRAVLAHGYRIVPPAGTGETVAKSSQVERELGGLRELFEAADSTDLRSLITCWHATAADCRWSDLELSRRFIERLLEFNEPLLAYDFVTEGLQWWPHDTRLMQLMGLSLARSGAARKANQIFQQLREAGHVDEETLGNLARTYKTLWSESQDENQRRTYLEAAYNAYLVAYLETKGYWSGINVAFLALVRGDHDHARETATRVYEQCAAELDATRMAGQDLYWLTATLGEASLIRGDYQEAVQWYRRATAIAGRRYGNIASTRRQARELSEYLGLDWERFAACFPLPVVVVFAPAALGDDVPAATVSASLQRTMAEAMRGVLQSRQHVFGFSCLRNWLDLAFLETELQGGGDVTVLLENEQRERGDAAAGDRWPAEFTRRANQILDACFEVHHLTARTGAATVHASEYVSKILIGLASMHARQLGTLPVILTPVPRQEEGGGENRWLLEAARGAGLQIIPIHLGSDIIQAGSASPDDTAAGGGAAEPTSDTILAARPRTMALLFADVKGFSRLNETELITFARAFLGKVSGLLRLSTAQPATRQTWGDGLFFTFEQIEDAGTFALDLADLIESTDWQQLGLPADLSLRIGLHAGPVYKCMDPVSRQTTFCGIHVNHAARIEPITPPGNVYASEAFAALASGGDIRSFVCEYVGQTPLAKDFGLFSTYHVRRVAIPPR